MKAGSPERQQLAIGFWREVVIPLFPWLSLSLGVLLTIVIARYDYQLTHEPYRDLAKERLLRLKIGLENAFYKRLSVTMALEAFAQNNIELDRSDPGDEARFRERFKRFTGSLERRIDGVMSMQLAPDAVVTYLTNEERNRKAIGHDLIVDDERREQVLATIERKSQIVAGPLTLIQGGEAIIARQAIFTSPGAFSVKRYIAQGRGKPDDTFLRRIPYDFWGLATVVIDTGTLYREAGLMQTDSRFEFAIRGRHGLGESGEVFWGRAEVFDKPLAKVTIALPDGSWIVAVQMNSDTIIGWRTLFRSL